MAYDKYPAVDENNNFPPVVRVALSSATEFTGKFALKFAPLVVNVKDPAYGALGDGINDDRPAIQAAINAAGIGGTIYFPMGTYLLGSSSQVSDRVLVLLANQKIIGAGRDLSTIKIKNNFGGYKTIFGATTESTNLNRVTLQGIGFDQNHANGNVYTSADASALTNFRHVLRCISGVTGSSVTVTDCRFDNVDSMNTLYVAAHAIDISRNIWQGTGAANTAFRDHSSIYASTNVDDGTQTIVGNTFIGNIGAGSAVCAIETHGGIQSITGNVISGYMIGANLTGWTSTYRTKSISFYGNQINNCLVGVQVWSRYSGTITSGFPIRNVQVVNNNITLNRDLWMSVTGMVLTAWGINFEEGSTAPLDGLIIAENNIEFKSTASAVAGDYKSNGIRLVSAYAAAVLSNAKILNNQIIGPLSTGMHISGVIKSMLVAGNTVENPAQSTDSSIVAVYKSFGVLSGTLTDVEFKNNKLTDNRGTHTVVYGLICLASMTSATNLTSMDNSVTFADGVIPPAFMYPSSAANCAPFIRETVKNWPGVFQPAMAGSVIRETATGKLYKQTATPTGTTWGVVTETTT